MNSESVKPDYTSISKLIEEAHEQKLMLPEFQRPFVWNIEQSKDLFDSLIRGIFIGTFVLAKPQFGLSCRPIDTRPRAGKGSRAKVDPKFFKEDEFEALKTYVVLDGQQRISSLYRVLKGNDKIFFIFKKPSDIPSPSHEITDIEQIIDSLSVKPVDDAFSIQLSEVYRCATWKDKDIEQKIFEPIAAKYSFLTDRNIADRYLNLLLDLKRLFYDLIQDKTLLSVFFLNMGIEKFCMFFERSNSKGTELSFIDIITAKIYKDFKLDREINKFKERNRGISFSNATVEAFVRYLAYIKAGQVDRKTILTSLDGIDFSNHWDELVELYTKSYNFIKNQKIIYKIDSLPYTTMFIPIMHFLKHLPHKDFSQITPRQMSLFKFWFWGSLLNTRYGGGMVGSTNDIIVEDCNILAKIAEGEKFPKDYLRKFKFDYTFDDLLELTSNGAIFTGIMSLMNYRSNTLKNLGNDLNIDYNSQINIHHIFPSKYLERNFDLESFENENSDSILNKMITEKIPNLKFSDKRPSAYLQELRDNPNITQSLNSHLISMPEKLIDGTYDRLYKDFVQERSRMIIELIENEIGYLKLELLEEIEKSNISQQGLFS